MSKILILRVIHGLFALYFIFCVMYLYYAALAARVGVFLYVAILSLAVEGLLVFVLNKGDCPLIHVQKRIGDSTPFFELFLPARIAKNAIPFFTRLTWIGLALLVLRLWIG